MRLPQLSLVFALMLGATVASCSDGDSEDGGAATPGGSAAASPTTIPLVNAAAICASNNDPTAAAVVSPDVREASGLAASRRQSGVIWTHNDSGDTPRLFALGLEGETLGVFELRGAEAIDWEDMAIGPGSENGDYLYVGDIGDNAALREVIHVYRAKEPLIDPAASSLVIEDVERLVLQYRDGAHDAETLLVDPVSGDLLIVTKELATGVSGVYRAPAQLLSDGGVVTMEREAEIDFMALRTQKEIPAGAPPLANVTHVPTGGDVSPDGSVIAIRTYATVWVWDRSLASPLAEAFSGRACEGPSEIEPQGEALAFGEAGTSYFTLSEGANQPAYHFKFD